jgi:hypothetical protein
MLNTTGKVCIFVVSYETLISITAIKSMRAARIDN